MRAVREKAYAKINLHLDVLGRREDGFHDIRTVMHTVSLCDDITVSVSDGGKGSIRIILDGNRWLPTDRKNLCYMAAEKFLERAGIRTDVTIKLRKRIPVSAGLAGGSADAAAVLRALNRVYRRPLTDRAILDIASAIGSDVPFCLLLGTALCEGRGEIITRLPGDFTLNAVIATAEEHVSTPAAYTALDSLYSDFRCGVDTGGDEHFRALMSGIELGEIPKKLFNVFEAAVLPTCPGAAGIRTRLMELGAKSAMMSGSGPSVFGIFSSENEAEEAAAILCGEGVFAVSVRSAP